MTFRAIRSLILGLMYYRWARYVIAVGFLLFAVPFTMAALEETNIVQRTGIATHVGYYSDADTGDYVYSELMLTGSTTTYVFHRNEFTTALPEEKLSDAKVDLWVLAGPLEDRPHVVAIRLYDDQGNSVKYVTDGYTHAEDHRNRDLVPGAILLTIALAFIVAGAFAPTAPRPVRRKAAIAADGTVSPRE